MEDEMKKLSGEELSRHIEEYQTLSHLFELKGGPSYRSEVEGALIVLGFERSDFSRNTDTLSGGQKTRLSLARILMGSPDLLILDEPVSGIDENAVRNFYRLVDEMKHKHDLAVLLVSHDLELVRKYADKVVLLDNTILCQGKPSEVFENDSFKKVFGGGAL